MALTGLDEAFARSRPRFEHEPRLGPCSLPRSSLMRPEHPSYGLAMVRDVVGELPDGSLRSPAGVTYRRTAERVRRAIGNELVAAGAAIVTNVYPDGLQWHEGQEATSLWEQIKPRLVIGGRPNPRYRVCGP